MRIAERISAVNTICLNLQTPLQSIQNPLLKQAIPAPRFDSNHPLQPFRAKQSKEPRNINSASTWVSIPIPFLTPATFIPGFHFHPTLRSGHRRLRVRLQKPYPPRRLLLLLTRLRHLAPPPPLTPHFPRLSRFPVPILRHLLSPFLSSSISFSRGRPKSNPIDAFSIIIWICRIMTCNFIVVPRERRPLVIDFRIGFHILA